MYIRVACVVGLLNELLGIQLLHTSCKDVIANFSKQAFHFHGVLKSEYPGVG